MQVRCPFRSLFIQVLLFALCLRRICVLHEYIYRGLTAGISSWREYISVDKPKGMQRFERGEINNTPT